MCGRRPRGRFGRRGLAGGVSERERWWLSGGEGRGRGWFPGGRIGRVRSSSFLSYLSGAVAGVKGVSRFARAAVVRVKSDSDRRINVVSRGGQ